MATSIAMDASSAASPRWFAAAAATTIAVSCVLAGWLPIGVSVIAVFLFAGPHNWMEARYMLTRMPARWGKLRRYFLVGSIGVPGLAVLAAALPHAMRLWQANPGVWLAGIATWNTLLALWIATLVHLRSGQNPRRHWPWTWPICFLVIALAWLWPMAWSMAIVYLHPLIAVWFLDRELAKRNPQWRIAFQACAAMIPLLLAVLWWRLAAAPDLPGQDILSLQISNHAGGRVFTNVSTHFLVAAHTFLELIHYGVWIVAIPLVSGSASWRLSNVPLAKRSSRFCMLVVAVLAFGVGLMLILWAAFLADFPLTRDIYFTVAMLHVLAEIPFLLRLL